MIQQIFKSKKKTEHLHQYGEFDDTDDFSRQSQKDYDNPFRIPTDEEVFVMRDEEKKRKKLEREMISKMPVHEKKTWSTRIPVQRHIDHEFDHEMAKLPPISKVLTTESSKNGTSVYSTEKENMVDFIEKKRKMFLIQMSLDTKKFEIKKLEKKAEEREKKLEEEEVALHRDSTRFDQFLSENDIKAVEAANAATAESKAKKLKQDEIKVLSQKKNSIQTEIAKLDEQLSKCQEYKDFLESLAKKFNLAKKSDLEEENLRLIQTSQGTEEQLEELRKKHRTERERKDKEAALLREQIESLNDQIRIEEQKASEIKKKANVHTDEDGKEKLKKYTEKIVSIYKEAGFDMSLNSNIKPLQMLAHIESRLEELIASISKIKPEVQKKFEASQQKKRRKKILDDRQNRSKQLQEERKERMIKLSQTAPKKKQLGKPLMKKSSPLGKKKKERNENETEQEKIERDEFKELFSINLTL